MAKKVFTFKSTVEELEIAGVNFSIDFSDEKLKEYQRKYNGFHERSIELERDKKATDEMSDEEMNAYYEASLNLCEELIDAIIGEGSFKKIYDLSGKSIFNMIDVVEFLADVVGEKTNKLRNDNRSKYTNTHKQNRYNNKDKIRKR